MRFHIPQMTCGHCVRTLHHAMETAFPGAPVVIDLGRRELDVDVDAAARPRLVGAIQAAGYEPVPIER